jgi:hypothetical protein
MPLINFKMKKILSVFSTIVFLIIIIMLKTIYEGSNVNYIIWLKINSIVGWTTLIWSIMSWKILRDEIISLYTMFLILLYSFTFGQSLLIIFDLVAEDLFIA